MKILTIVGARPQFIKAAAVSREIRKDNQEILVHTGQHYDTNMSDIFFEELSIPMPDYNLGVGSSSHAKQTAEMMIGIEEILIKENPDYIMVYGDTNSTLAGALVASKIFVPIIHIEAGLRSFNMAMPEEQNRILTDRLSKYLFCPTDTAVKHLKNEGITKGVYNTGDVMCDAVTYYSQKISEKSKQYYFKRLKGLYEAITEVENWYVATIHRAENTDTVEKLEEILKAFERLQHKVIFPVHPRIKQFITKLYEINCYKNILFVEPVGYLDMLYFIEHAIKVVTDSGGLQKEAYILQTPCVTIREQTEWIETLEGNHNVLCSLCAKEIISKTHLVEVNLNNRENYYGTGNAARQICEIIKKGVY